jgi:hypothetical protein
VHVDSRIIQLTLRRLKDMALTGTFDDTSSERSEDVVVVSSKEQPEDEAITSVLTADALDHHNASTNPTPVIEEEVKNAAKASSQVGVGVFLGTFGLFLGGPIFGALLGGAAAYAASNDEGPVGNAARSTGEWALTTGTKVGEAVREADERHGIIDKLKELFTSEWQRVRQFDEEHHASERVKEILSDVSEKTVEFERKHHVVENLLEGIQNGVKFLLDKLRGATENETNAS